MKNWLTLFILAAAAMMSSACGSSATGNSGTKSNSSSASSNSTAANSQANPSGGDSNVAAGISTAPVDANIAINVPPAGNADTSNRRKVVDDPTGKSAKPMSVPALEDSEMITTMGKHGEFITTRVFKSHPQLAKVEVIMTGPPPNVVKIYLRNGKVAQITSDKITQLNTESTAKLLELAGVKPQAPPQGRDPKKIAEEKKQ